MNGIVSGIVTITIGVIMLVNVFLPQVFGANTSTWDASSVAMWSVVGLAGVIGIVVGVFNVFGIL